MTSRGHDPTRQAHAAREANAGRGSDPASQQSVGAGATRQSAPQTGDVTGDWFPKAARYRQLGDPIAGGMGVVFHALDVNLDIEVAIKRIRPEYTSHQELISRFDREAKTQVRLRHPNLVTVRDFAHDELGPYIVMDWVKGRSLAQALKEDGPFEWQRAAAIINKVTVALQVAHNAGIIHRDIKPANILLDDADEPFVADFGLVRLEVVQSVASETMTGALLGTVDFIAPEQLEDPRNASVQSDIWSLGATLYRLVTGRSVRGMRESLIPEPLRDIVLKSMEEDESLRYPTMEALHDCLNALIAVGGKKNPSLDGKRSESQPVSSAQSFSAMLQERRRDIELIQQRSLQAIDQSDYAQAVALLDELPSSTRDQELYEEAVRRRDRIIELRAMIEVRVREMNLANLDVAVAQLLELTPQDKDLQSLMQELPRRNGARVIVGQLLAMHKLPLPGVQIDKKLKSGFSPGEQKPASSVSHVPTSQLNAGGSLLDNFRKFFKS